MSWCHGHRGDPEGDRVAEGTFRVEDDPEDGHEVEGDHDLDAVHGDAVEVVHDAVPVTDSDGHFHRDTQPFYDLVPFEMVTLVVIRGRTLRGDVPSVATIEADADSTYVEHRDAVGVDAEDDPYSEPLDFRVTVHPMVAVDVETVIRADSEAVPDRVSDPVLVVVPAVVLEGDPEDDGVLQIEARY